MVLKHHYNFFINVDHYFKATYVKMQCTNSTRKAYLAVCRLSHCLFSFPILAFLNTSLSTPEIQISVPRLNSGSESMANFPSAQRKKRCHSLLLSGFFFGAN